MGNQTDNPGVMHFTGTTDSIDSTTSEAIRKIATTKANALLDGYSAIFPTPVRGLEVYNNSTGGETVRISLDGGQTWLQINPSEGWTLEPRNTSKVAGRGYFFVEKIHIIASASTAKVDIIPHFGE
jgi:hypothetical protein